jgi:hypothetical protein
MMKVDTLSEANGILFLCPKCERDEAISGKRGVHSVVCLTPAVPKEWGQGPGRWPMTGTSFEDLTLTPSIWLTESHCGLCKCNPGEYCGWHGFILNGEVTFC